MIKSIGIALCQVWDMDRAVTFYRDLLGMTPGVMSPYWSDLTIGNFKVGLHPPFAEGPKEVGRGWILGIEVDDLQSLRAALEAAGTVCAPYHDVPGGCVMDFADPDGNPLEAMQTGVSAKDLG